LDRITDNALMMQVKNGEPNKMGPLFERYHRALFGFLFQMTKDKESSEDMVQQVFFRMLKYAKTFTGNGEFKTWMYHLARNVLFDHLKKNEKKKDHYSLQGLEEKTAGDYFADESLEKKQELQTLSMAIDNLSEANRELLILCRYQRLNYQEIAHILDISEGAVKVRMHRALGQLKTSYLKIAN
jgi:RNA polymerase sigma factor (sigma-70 family)